MKNLKDQHFGMLTAIEPTDQRAGNSIVWRCKCDCGNETLASAYALTRGQKKSCGCLQAASRKRDLTGQIFGWLKALEPTDKIVNHSVIWKFECTRCGSICEHPAESVLWGGRKSCGCLYRDNKSKQALEMQKNCGREDGTMLCRIKTDKPQANNRSGIRGVHWHKGRGAWRAVLKFRGKVYSGGYYADINDAAKARKELEDKYFQPYIDEKINKNSGDAPD